MNSEFTEHGGNWKNKYTKGQRKMKALVWRLLWIRSSEREKIKRLKVGMEKRENNVKINQCVLKMGPSGRWGRDQGERYTAENMRAPQAPPSDGTLLGIVHSRLSSLFAFICKTLILQTATSRLSGVKSLSWLKNLEIKYLLNSYPLLESGDAGICPQRRKMWKIQGTNLYELSFRLSLLILRICVKEYCCAILHRWRN